MKQYIDKSALVAEIERRRDAALRRQHNLEAIGQETVCNEMVANELNIIISLLDTLEVEERETKSGIVQKDLQILLDDGMYIDLDPSMQLKPSFSVKEGERVKVAISKEV